jgi:hypothetical protein
MRIVSASRIGIATWKVNKKAWMPGTRPDMTPTIRG